MQVGEPYRSSVSVRFMGNALPKLDAAEFSARLHTVLDGVKGAPARDEPKTSKEPGRGLWLAQLFGVSKANGGDWVNGTHMPRPSYVLAMCDRWNVSFMWLYFGRGAMNDSSTSLALNAGHDSESASRELRTESLMLALQESADALAGEHPTPMQKAQHIKLLYTLIEDGMALAQVRHVARRAAPDTGETARAAKGNSDAA